MVSKVQRARSDGTIAYAARFRHLGRETSVTFDTAGARDAFVRNANALGTETALDLLDLVEPDDVTVAEALTAHIDSLTAITDGTRKDYQQIAAMIAAHPLGALPVQAVTRQAVTAWVRSMQDAKLSAKTIRNRHSLLSAALNAAVDGEVLTANPARGVKVGRSIVEPAVFLTPAEFDVFFARVTPHYRPLVRFLFGTGLRIGEATALTVADVDLGTRPATVTVTKSWKRGTTGMVVGPPKTRKGRRTISLPTEVVADLRPLVKRDPGELLFVSQTGGVVRSTMLRRKWDKWRRDDVWDPSARTRVPRVPRLGKAPRIHDARHSHASWLIAQGVDLPTLQHRLGHEHITTTIGTYGHLLPEAQVQAARAASLAFQSARPAPAVGEIGPAEG